MYKNYLGKEKYEQKSLKKPWSRVWQGNDDWPCNWKVKMIIHLILVYFALQSHYYLLLKDKTRCFGLDILL